MLKSVPFRGVSCSDAAGSQKCYWEIMQRECGAPRGRTGPGGVCSARPTLLLLLLLLLLRCTARAVLAPGRAVNTTDVRWDATQQSPYFNYRHADGSIHQVHFDSPASLARKYQVAADLGLRGLGVWNYDCLAYGSSDPLVQRQTADMWAAIKQAVAAFKPAPHGAGAGQL
jgi:di-N-acetylchitobiase